VKHHSVAGEGRLYTHTAEGQVFAVEQESGRLLWRRHFPGVHVSFTAPLFHGGRVYLPQAGLDGGKLRVFHAATGELIWEAPFTGSPSWNRQLPPIVHEGLVFYLFSTGRYTPKTWLFEHQSTFGFPQDQRPIVQAWDAESGRPVWTIDFSRYGAGGDDAGLCLLDGKLYYSCYFGGKGVTGITAAIVPKTGDVEWLSTKHSVHAGSTVSGREGRIYLGGYNPVEGDQNRVWCLDAKSGDLVWKSDPVTRAIHGITLGKRFLFTHSQYQNAYLLSPRDGTVLTTLLKGYNCTRFTLSEPYLLGSNMDVWDTRGEVKLVSTGPAVDVLQCVGAMASNGRLFYTTNGGGIQLSMLCGKEALR
jgi:outer membrane protein assembly factor BamB